MIKTQHKRQKPRRKQALNTKEAPETNEQESPKDTKDSLPQPRIGTPVLVDSELEKEQKDTGDDPVPTDDVSRPRDVNDSDEYDTDIDDDGNIIYYICNSMLASSNQAKGAFVIMFALSCGIYDIKLNNQMVNMSALVNNYGNT